MKKAVVIHPVGIGKSYIAFILCEGHGDEKICWLSPNEYIFKTQLENIKQSNPEFNVANITFITYAKLTIMTESELSFLNLTYITFMYSYQKAFQKYETKIQKAKYKSVFGKAEKYLEELRRALHKAV